MSASSASLSDLAPHRPKDLRFVAERFRRARAKHDLSRKTLAREAGYHNLAKGLRRLDTIESDRPPMPDDRVLERFARVLDIDLEAVHRRLRQHARARRMAELEEHPPVLGPWLRRTRRRRDLSRAGLADGSGLQTSTVPAIESGATRFPRDAILKALCDALDVAPADARQARSCEFDHYDRLADSIRITARAAPAVRTAVDAPGDISAAQAVTLAETYAADTGLRVVVTLGEARTIEIWPDGERSERC